MGEGGEERGEEDLKVVLKGLYGWASASGILLHCDVLMVGVRGFMLA